MSKPLAENSCPIKISSLRQKNLLPGGGMSILNWSNGNKVRIYINTSYINNLIPYDENEDRTPVEEEHIRLIYTCIDNDGKKEKLDYRIDLTATTPNFGGKRYWFCCYLCYKRVGVLYLIGKYFGCRYCGNISYQSQLQGGKFRESSVDMSDIVELGNSIKRTHYAGWSTRKYERLMKMEKKFINNLAVFVKKLGG